MEKSDVTRARAHASIPAHELVRRVKSGEVRAIDILTEFRLIESSNASSRAYNWTHPRAVEIAESLDIRRARGEPLGRLAGIPIAVKDSIATLDAPTTAGSRVLGGPEGPNYVSPFEAHVVERLRAEDAIVVGKTNMDEFGMGSSGEHAAHPATHPGDPARVAGGSSGGSAVAVATRQVPIALGTDTGGSVRQPAAFNGIYGLKPTYGAVSRYGLIAFASSLDQAGLLTWSLEDLALAFSIVEGRDPRDSTSLARPEAAPQELSPKALRVGLPREYFTDGIAPGIRAQVLLHVEKLRALGARIEETSLPSTNLAGPAYYVLSSAEASSNLARFDGVRFGRQPKGGSLREARSQFGQEVKRRILLGTYVLSSGYYDAYYRKAENARGLIADEFARSFRDFDVLITPTTPTTAFLKGQRLRDPVAMYQEDLCTLPASLAGLPALSCPAGEISSEPGDLPMPVGLQLIGPRWSEPRLLQIASLIR